MATSAQLTAARIAIRVRCGQLCIDEDARREMMRNAAGVSSSKDLDFAGCQKVLEHLARLGAINPKAGRRTVRPSTKKKPLIDKIYKLLDELSIATGKRKTLRYADAIARERGWGETVELCSPERLRDVVAALNRTLQSKLHG